MGIQSRMFRLKKKGSASSALVVLILLTCVDVTILRRGGGGGRYRGAGSRYGSYRKFGTTKYKKSAKPTGYFGKGGINTFGKVVLATYVAKKLRPSVHFQGHREHGFHNRPTFCQECISVNGSDEKCEKGIAEYNRLKMCVPTRHRPYCSTEYGVTADDLRYVRRSCNERRCNTCSSHLSDVTNSTKKCHVVQCDMCNWDGCNTKSVIETFHDGWSGCLVDSSIQRSTFTADDTCAGCSLSRNLMVTAISGLVAHLMLKL